MPASKDARLRGDGFLLAGCGICKDETLDFLESESSLDFGDRLQSTKVVPGDSLYDGVGEGDLRCDTRPEEPVRIVLKLSKSPSSSFLPAILSLSMILVVTSTSPNLSSFLFLLISLASTHTFYGGIYRRLLIESTTSPSPIATIKSDPRMILKSALAQALGIDGLHTQVWRLGLYLPSWIKIMTMDSDK